MRLKTQTSVSVVVLLAMTLGLGACAAHKREAVVTARAARDRQSKTPVVPAADPSAPVASDAKWAAVLSPDAGDQTYALDSYNLKIVKADKTQLAEVKALSNSPIVSGGAGTAAPVKTAVTVAKSKDVKDTDIASALTQIHAIVNEFSAKDGTVLSGRKDSLVLKDAASSSYDDAVSIALPADKASKVTNDAAWSAMSLTVIKKDDKTIEIDRVSALDDKNQIMAQEVLIYHLSNPMVDTAADKTAAAAPSK